MSNSVRPHRWQPTRLPCPWDSPGKNAGVGCHFLLQCMKVKSESEIAQSCLTLLNPMDYSLPGSSIRGVFQARVWDWGAIAFSDKESWVPKWWKIDAFELWCWRRLLRVPWTSRWFPKGNQSWLFIGRTDAEAETPILQPPDVKIWLIAKDPDAGKDWRWEEKETTEDEMVGWHHQLNGHEFEQAPGVGDGQGRLVCCSPWDHKGLDMTDQLNWTQLCHHEVFWFI